MQARQRRSFASPDPQELSSASMRVLRRFRLVFNAVKSHFRDVERKAGLAGAQVWALSVVAGSPGLTVGDMARAMDVHQSTASNLLRSLIGNGLVMAERSPIDKRVTLLRITPAGARRLKKAPGPASGVLPEALSRLDPKVLARLDRDLGMLLDVLRADERAAQIPLGQPDR